MQSGSKNLSFEFFPPKTDKGKEKLKAVIEKLKVFSPEYFSVTYGAGGSTRAGTLETCITIKEKNELACPHISGIGSSKKLITEMLDEYKANNMQRIVVLRGDLPSGSVGHGDFPYALDLIKFIKETEDSFLIEIAAYPEIHPDASSADNDFQNFVNKVEAGASGAITQFFFEPESYFDFAEKCEKRNISIPVIPGIMPVHNFEAMTRMAKNCGANIPNWLQEAMQQYPNEIDLIKYGTEVISVLCNKLIDFGAPGIHFYTVNKEEPTSSIIRNLSFN